MRFELALLDKSLDYSRILLNLRSQCT